MTRRRIFFILYSAIIVAITGCKKDTSEVASTPHIEKKVVVTTIAGEGTGAFADGPALTAKFFAPIDVAVASDGTLFVADFRNHRIRKISGGQVSTLAGNDSLGLINGHGLSAQFKFPYRIALDGTGNMYVLDEGTPIIRKISASADVSDYAGTDQPGFLNGAALTAQFQSDESAVIADQSGNIYIGDTFNNLIRKINPAGQVSTVAGTGAEGFRDGSADSAQFRYPLAIAFDKRGNMYIADEGNFCIRKITSDGMVSTFSGSGASGNEDGDRSTAQFNNINDMVSDSQGNLFVADENRIRKITAQGVVATIAGGIAGYVDGNGASARFNGIGGIGIDAQGNIYVSDIVNNRIRKISFQ